MKRKLFILAQVFLASMMTVVNAQSFSAEKTYTIECNNMAGKYMQDNGDGYIVPKDFNDNSYWYLIPTGNEGCYYVKNATTNRYMQKTSEYQVSVKTGNEPVEIFIKNDPAKGATVYGMASTDRNPHDFANDNTYGANYNGDSGVVQGFCAALGVDGRPNSFWKIIGHSFTNGVCSDNCTEKYQAPALVDGWYQLGNVGNVEWFSAQIADGNSTYKAKLTADIDYEGLGANYHTPIGNYGKKFIGKFDGCGYSIKNMVLVNPTRPKTDGSDGYGFFGCVQLQKT